MTMPQCSFCKKKGWMVVKLEKGPNKGSRLVVCKKQHLPELKRIALEVSLV